MTKNLSKRFMTCTRFMLTMTLFWVFGIGIYAQVGELTGSNICNDGRQTTNIGISGFDPGKYYALYRNDEMLQVRQSSVEVKDQGFTFGTFKETGSYMAVAFDHVVKGFPARLGKPVKGKITISPVPVLFMGDTLKIKSGEVLNYAPRADVQEASFTWSAYVKSGNASGYHKQGSGAIHDTLRAAGDRPACVIYAITPHSADHIVSCNGDPRDLVIVIRP